MKITYTMFYTENVTDLLSDKLTLIFNKAILNMPVRLLLAVPKMFDIKRTYKYRELFEEVSINRFSPEVSSFWNYRNVIKYVNYCMSLDLTEDDKSIFISQNILVPSLPAFPEMDTADLLVRKTYDLENLNDIFLSIIEMLNEVEYEHKCSDIVPCYDFGCCIFSNKLKKSMFIELKEVMEKFKNIERFLNDQEAHILLSILFKKAQITDPEITVVDMNLPVAEMDTTLVQSMYSLL